MINASSLLSPVGEIEVEFFPEESSSTVAERLDVYLAEGFAKSTALGAGAVQDTAASAWAYHRAYRAIYTRLLAAPSSVTKNDEGSAAYTGQQIAAFGTLADRKLAEFDGLVIVPAAASSPPSASGSTVHSFAW